MKEEFVEWNPELSLEEEALVQQAEQRIRRRSMVMRELRQMLGLTQKEMSELLETTQSNVSKMEQKADPTLSMIKQIVEAKGGKLHLFAEIGGRSIELSI